MTVLTDLSNKVLEILHQNFDRYLKKNDHFNEYLNYIEGI